MQLPSDILNIIKEFGRDCFSLEPTLEYKDRKIISIKYKYENVDFDWFYYGPLFEDEIYLITHKSFTGKTQTDRWVRTVSMFENSNNLTYELVEVVGEEP